MPTKKKKMTKIERTKSKIEKIKSERQLEAEKGGEKLKEWFEGKDKSSNKTSTKKQSKSK